MAEIEYFYSAHSAYAYIGSARFIAIAMAAGRRIAHRPRRWHRASPLGHDDASPPAPEPPR